MCGRFTLKTPAQDLATLFEGLSFSGLRPRYNICPTQMVSCVRNDLEGDRQLAALRWGLVPFWAKDLKMGARMINARSETVSEKPSFRAAFKKRRCLVLADGFYEWKKEGKQKQPYYISLVDHQPFTLAGLWESWTDKKSDETVETCTILTTTANESMQPLHDRMPVFLDEDKRDVWLDAEFQDKSHLESMLVPYAEGRLQAWPVDKMVNKPVNDLPACIEPIKRQSDLF